MDYVHIQQAPRRGSDLYFVVSLISSILDTFVKNVFYFIYLEKYARIEDMGALNANLAHWVSTHVKTCGK